MLELREKQISRCFQFSCLSTYVAKCEQDLRDNYPAIMEQLRDTDFQHIVDCYSGRLRYYIGKVSVSSRAVFTHAEAGILGVKDAGILGVKDAGILGVKDAGILGVKDGRELICIVD